MAIINGKKSLQVVKTQGVAVNVEANPAGTATDTLEKVLIDDTIYAVEGGASQVDDELSPTSVLPVQNKVITAALEEKANVDGYYETFGYARESGVAANLKNRENAFVGATYTKRTAGGTADIGTGTALIKRLKGNSIVFNQLVQNGNFANTDNWTSTSQIVSKTASNNVLTITTNAATDNTYVRQEINFINGHKYLITFDIKNNDSETNPYSYFTISAYASTYSTGTMTTAFTKKAIILNYSETSGTRYFNVGARTNTAVALNYSMKNVMCIDLTQMFGAGNEPSTVADFKTLFPADYYAYNAGEIINFNGTGIKTVGFNQYNNATGTAALLGGNQYQISGTYTSVSYEDLNGNAETLTIDGNGLFTPTNTGTLTVVGGNATDTCVHLTWSGYRNGEFEAYKENTLTFDISSIKDGNDDTLFTNGLCKAGTAYDEVTPNDATKCMGSHTFTGNENYTFSTSGNRVIVNILTKPSGKAATTNGISTTDLNFVDNNYNVDGIYISTNAQGYLTVFVRKYGVITDVDTAKAYLVGKTIQYELATPVKVTFATPLNLGYAVDDFGTEQMLPYEPTTTPTTSPINYDVLYALNATDFVRNADKNFISKSSFDNFTTALIGAMATIGYTMTVTPTYDSANNEYDFNVTLAATPQGE